VAKAKARASAAGVQQGGPVQREVIPNAGRTMSALREMGYDSYASVMDLIDNSIDAGAKRIDVTIREASPGNVVVEIQDDGRGMDEPTLVEALKLGSDVEKYNEKKRLGKFGMGLVTASLSMAQNIWVITRQKDKPAFEATLDLGVIQRKNKFVISVQPAQSDKVVGTLDKHGTIVRLSQIDRISDRNVARFAANLRTRLGRVYRHFLSEGIDIGANKRLVQRDDPLLLEDPQTEVKLDTEIDLGDGSKGRLVAVELPDFGTSGDAEHNIFPHNSGFYVVRNGREIIAGETFGFYRHHHSYSHFRAELRYTGNSGVFHEDIKKSSIHPDDRLLEKLRKLTEKLIAESGRRNRDKPEAAPVLSHRSSSDVINTKLVSLIGGKQALAEAVRLASAPLPPPPVNGQAEKPAGKRGRPSKEELAKREEQQKVEAEAKAKLPPAPSVEFVEVDSGDEGRFFTSEQKDHKLVIAYNTRHPLVRMVADAKQKQAHTVLDLVAFALAKAEGDVPEGRKLVNRACDYLKVLAAPAVPSGQGAGHGAE
jgi:hypothetical protein